MMPPKEIPVIPFHVPFVSGDEERNIKEAIGRREFSGDGYYTGKCEKWLERFTRSRRIMLTPSCTHALEMCALLLNIRPGDEVIMPSFNFVSGANAFVLRGARIVFVDIRPDTMNIDEQLLESAITIRTKVIVVVHYGGVACEMDNIMALARSHGIFVVEDAAHGIGAYYKGQHLGTIGHLGVLSFHSSKNIHCGEGGALMINDSRFEERAEIIREKGTNRKAFLRGDVSKYSWLDLGSSYLLSELNAAFLYGQLLHLAKANDKRISIYQDYQHLLQSAELKIEIGAVPPSVSINAHIFFIKCENRIHRNRLQSFLGSRGIIALFHYIPLHTSHAGRRFGHFFGQDRFTTTESERLLRLPIYAGFTKVETVCSNIHKQPDY